MLKSNFVTTVTR